MNRDVKLANEMLVMVAEMLRRGLDQVRTQEVTLAEEVGTAELYLQIEQIRFGDRLSVVWRIDPDVKDALVPHMLLQPIIENAVRHGIETRSRAGRVEISALPRGRQLQLEVRDDGQGFSQSSRQGGLGIGLSVTRERLKQLYGGDHSFDLTNAADGGDLVRISITLIRSSGKSSQKEEVYVQTDPRSDR